jgi:hypothetical protein
VSRRALHAAAPLLAAAAFAAAARAQSAPSSPPPPGVQAGEPATAPPAAVATLSQLRFDRDGRTLVGIADAASRSPAFQAYDAATGRPSWRLPFELLREPGSPRAVVPERWQPSAVAGQLLLEARGDLFLADAAREPKLRRLTSTRLPEEGAALSPDGQRVAFARGGDLYAIELGSGRETRLTRDGAPPRIVNAEPSAREILDGGAGCAWSPDSRTLVYLRREGEALRFGTALVLTADAQLVDTGPAAAGALEEIRWRYDGRALGVERRTPDGAQLQLLLCQPERRYCRRLAERGLEPNEAPKRDLDFFADGFLWGASPGVGLGLARYDTLGRERFRHAAGDWRLERLVLVDEPRRLVLARATRGDASGATVGGLLRLELAAESEPLLLAAGGEEAAIVSPSGAVFVATLATDAGSRRELRTTDGKRLAPLPPPEGR